jgi:hypothetical protein
MNLHTKLDNKMRFKKKYNKINRFFDNVATLTLNGVTILWQI